MLTTVITVFPRDRFAYAMSASLAVSRNVTLVSSWSATLSRRMWLMRWISGSSGPSSARSLISYFSEFRYSSEPSRTGTFS